MKIKIITRSPNGIQENPYMAYLKKQLKEFEKPGQSIESLNDLKTFIEDLGGLWKGIDPSLNQAPLILQLRHAECCGEELVIAQGDVNILVREDKS